MSDNDIEKLQRLQVPKGAIRPRLQPVPVSDYRSVVRQIERRERRERTRLEVVEALRERETARRGCLRSCWMWLCRGLPVIAIAVALVYFPLCQGAAVAFLKLLGELLGF